MLLSELIPDLTFTHSMLSQLRAPLFNIPLSLTYAASVVMTASSRAWST